MSLNIVMAAKKKTEVYAIHGMHLLVGSFDNTNSDEGTIYLKSALPSKEFFKGTVKVKYLRRCRYLKGVVTAKLRENARNSVANSLASN